MNEQQQDLMDKQAQEYRANAEAALASETTGSGGFAVLSAVGVNLLKEFAQAENDRRETELRWLADLRQYKGQYDAEVLAKIGKTRSRAFVRKTRVKVKTVDSRVMDLLFPANGNRNWDLTPTKKPTIAPEQKRELIQNLTVAMTPPPSAENPNPQPVKPTKDDIDKAVREMVETAAANMRDTIDDQLSETRYKDCARKVIHSGNLYGTGILKAPLVERKIRQRFVRSKAGKWELKTERYVTPFVDYVPLWRFYPDMSATDIEDCRYVYERHLMTKTATLKLAERKSFNGQRIIDYVMQNPNGQLNTKHFDTELKTLGDRLATNELEAGQFEVLERWGWLNADDLIAVGVKIPEERRHESFFSNIWLLPNGEIIKAVLQPINGVTWPYHLYYFDKDETSIFGEGVAAIMRDDQTMINAGARMILDNAAITAGSQLEVNMRLLAKNEKADEMGPFKIWHRTGEDPASPAVRVIEMASHLPELQNIVGMFEANADEVTAIPRYMTGENPQNGAAETSSGLSMLMGAAGIVMKDIVSSFDEGITKPFIAALYRWNMQFSRDDSIKGDYDVVATGTSSLVAKEIRANQLNMFAEMTANPLDEPYIKRDKLNEQRAAALELQNIVKTEDEMRQDQNTPQAQAQAQMQQAMQGMQMQLLQGQVLELQAKIAGHEAENERKRADALNKRLEAAYAAMEAAGLAVQHAGVAQAGDGLLRAAGWQDAPGANPADLTPAPVQGGAQVQIPPQGSPHAGVRAGIETGAFPGGVDR